MIASPITETARILVVDDLPELANIYRDMLLNAGWQASATTSANTAIAMFANEPADVVVTDVCMAEMSGLEMIREIRKQGHDPEVIVVSAFADSRQVVDTLRLRAFAHLDKPFTYQRLLECVSRALRRDRRTERLLVEEHAVGWLEITAPSHQEYIDRLDLFLTKLNHTNLSVESKHNLEIALREMLANAIEWGNRENIEKPVRLTYCFFRERLVIKVEDCGTGFDPAAVAIPCEDPLEQLAAREARSKRPGGYGIQWVKQCMDEVIFNDKGNTVLMSLRLNAVPANC